MSITDTLSGSAIPFGAEPVPAGQGLFGMIDAVRQQEAVTPGMAVAHRASTDATQYRDAFKFGNASARAEFWGVVCTKGGSPTMEIAAFAGNGQGISVLFLGYAPILVAPGQTVRRGMFLEPLASGTGQGMFRPVTAGGRGVVQALADVDNSAGTTGVWVSGFVDARGFGVGLVGAIVASSAALSLNAETIFSQSVVLAPANTIKVNDVFRVRAKARVTAGAAGNTLVIRSRLNTAAGVLLAGSTSFDPDADALIVLDFTITIRTIGAGGTLTSAGLALAAANANATGSAGTLAIDTTVANTLVVTADWNADTADAVVLEDLVIEKLA